MPNITFTTSRTSTDVPWIFPDSIGTGPTEYITQDDVDQVTSVYWDFVKSLAGFQEVQMVTVDSLTKKSIYVFDTLENTKLAAVKLSGPLIHSIPKARQKWTNEKMKNIGIEYTFSVSLVE
jgi:hypothetical protein